MNTKTTQTITKIVLPVLCALVLATPVSAKVTPKITHPVTKTAVKSETVSETKLKKTESEIDSRVSALTALENKITEMTRVSQEVKTQLTTTIQTTIASLSTLKTKLATDSATELKADMLTMTAGTRVYALVVPQVRLLAAADRATTVVEMLASVDTKLKTRIADAQTAGKDVTALNTTEADMVAKMTDAKTQIQAVLDGVSGLTPDNGDKTKLASTTLALKTARTALKKAEQDITSAQKDSKTIVGALKVMNGGKGEKADKATETEKNATNTQ